MKGLIFDINRFALHDGKGIRTTIFFKGCPLRCVWCQNPEGLEATPQLVYMKTTCIHCMQCVKLCRNQGIACDGQHLTLQREADEDWARLIDVCPAGALRYDASYYSVAQLLEEVKKDDVFYRHGGGITISGGEPFLQFPFLKALVSALKEKGYHVTVETSLYTDLAKIQEVLPYLDHLYVDLKLFDASLHSRYTGLDNGRIKDNLAWLLQSMYKRLITVRTPLIPTMSADDENLLQIAEFLHSCYPDVAYELLNYNPLARAKYEMCGKTYCFEDNPTLYTAQEMQHFYNVVQQTNLHNIVIEK